MSEPEEDPYGTLKPTKPAERRPIKRVPPPPGGTPDDPGGQPPQRPDPAPPSLVPVAEAPARRPDSIPTQGLARTPAVAFCKLFPLSGEAKELLTDKQALLPFLYQLMKQRLFLDAVRLLAHSLPRREAIRWARQCVRRHAGDDPPAQTAAALYAVEAWLAEPTEGNRQAAGAAAAAAGYDGAAGSAALAVFLSGGNIAPPRLPAVAPAEHVAARAVANAVILSALAPQPENAPQRYMEFLKEGIAQLPAASPAAQQTGK